MKVKTKNNERSTIKALSGVAVIALLVWLVVWLFRRNVVE